MKMPHQTRTEHRRRGAVIYAALFVLLPIAAVTFALLSVSVSSSKEHVRAGDDDRALLLAEAGLSESVQAMRSGASGNVADAATPAFFGDGALWVEVERLANALLAIRSTAMCGSGRVCLEQLVFEDSDSLFDSAIFSSQDLTVGSQCAIDSFDSTLGSYASQLTGGYVSDGAIVKCNGDVTIESSVEIHGDVHPGPSGSVEVPHSSSVSGSRQPLPGEVELTALTPPAIASSGPLTVTSDTVFPPGAYNFSSASVQGGTELAFQGPATIVIGDWNVASNADLRFDNTTGRIEVYVTGDVDLASNSTIVTESQSAVDFQLYLVGGPGQTADLRSNCMFYGAIYGSEAQVRVRSNFEVFGALVAESVLLDANVQIHYDEALQGLATTFDYTPAAWYRTDFADKALLSDRRDPFALLGVSPDALPTPADAHL